MWRDNFNPITGNRFFSGQSDQEKASQDFYNEIGGLKTDVGNRFEGYKPDFSYEDFQNDINNVYGGYEGLIRRDTQDQISEQQQGTASSMASRGITGGSALTDAKSKIASDINKTKSGALANLGISKSNVLSNLKEYFNNMKFNTTKAASDVDFSNISNLLAKLGLKGNSIAGLDDETWMDDLFAGLNAAGNIGKGIASIASGGAASGGGM